MAKYRRVGDQVVKGERGKFVGGGYREGANTRLGMGGAAERARLAEVLKSDPGMRRVANQVIPGGAGMRASSVARGMQAARAATSGGG